MLTLLQRRGRGGGPGGFPGGGPSEPSRRSRRRSSPTPRPLPLGHWGAWAVLVSLCLALYLPGFATLPPIDRDEARFAQATRQMLETGDFIRIRFQDEARNKKPVGIYWAQALSAGMFGGADAPIWAYRVPSLLGALGGVLLTFAIGARLFDRRTAFVGASLLGVSLLVIVEAHLAKTDAAMMAVAVMTQGSLGLLYLRARSGLPGGRTAPLVFWAGLGLGILLKGPVIPVVSLLTVIALGIADRSVGWLKTTRPLTGLLLLVAIVAPWTWAILDATQGTFFTEAVKGDLLPKLLGSQESHGAPPGYYLLLMVACFFPASLFAVPALVRAWRDRLLPAERFCLAWLIPAWILFELVPTKLPHYVLPLYPALALLTARFVLGGFSASTAMQSWWARLMLLPWGAVALALGSAAVALPWFLDQRLDLPGVIPCLGALVAVGAVVSFIWRGDLLRGPATAVAIAGFLATITIGFVLPRVHGLWLSRAADASVELRGSLHRVPIASAGYTEPSLVFLLGTETQLTSGAGAARFLGVNPTGLVLITDEQETAFRAGLAEVGLAVRELDRMRGFNYSRGRWLTLRLYQRML